MVKIIFLLLVFCLTGCQKNVVDDSIPQMEEAKERHLLYNVLDNKYSSKNADIVISEISTRKGAIKLCSELTTNVDKIRDYLKHSRVMTSRDIHQDFDWYGCLVKGTIKTQNQIYNFEIDFGGGGFILSPKKEYIHFGCLNCGELFHEK